MDEPRYRRDIKVLWSLFALAMIYSLWFSRTQALTGNTTVDSTLSVLIGLYICSRPAANAIDLFFFERARGRLLTEWLTVRWLALNILTLLSGWLVIFLGTTHFTSRGS
jgi:hypothetical protein